MCRCVDRKEMTPPFHSFYSKTNSIDPEISLGHWMVGLVRQNLEQGTREIFLYICQHQVDIPIRQLRPGQHCDLAPFVRILGEGVRVGMERHELNDIFIHIQRSMWARSLLCQSRCNFQCHLQVPYGTAHS